jgi:predicted DNA-binding WGR domain protein
MNSLVTTFESAIASAIKEYIDIIYSEHPEIPAGKLEELWNSTAESVQLSVSFKKSSKAVVKPKSTPKTKSKNSDDDEDDKEPQQSGCPYKYIKGSNKDQVCGSKPKEGNVFCSRHKKHEGSEIKERKLTPPSKMTNTAFSQEKSKPKSVAKDVQRVLRKHKTLGKLWHQESGLVFKCAKDRVVIGKCVNDTLNDLTEADLDECRKWGFSFTSIEEKDKSDPEPTQESYLISESENKFWSCKVEGISYTTTSGKIGKEGKTKTKECDSNDEAITIMNKNLKSKLNKGYCLQKEKNDISKLILETIGVKNSSKEEKTKPVTSKKQEVKKSSKKQEEEEEEEEEEEYEDEVKNLLHKLKKNVKSIEEQLKDEEDEEDEEEEEEELVDEE